MKSRIFILSGVLAAQLLLAGVLNLTGEEYGVFQAEEKLLSFDRQAVSGLRIEDGTDSVVLKKQEGQWLLPESGDFPASQRDVGNLLDNLAALQKGWPVARTRGAARRFSVDEDQFERKLKIIPHVAVREGKIVDSGRAGQARRRARRRQKTQGYQMSQHSRKRIEAIFGWLKEIGRLRRARFAGQWKIQLYAYAAAATYNFLRLGQLSAA